MKQSELKDLQLNDRITFVWKGKIYTNLVNDISYNDVHMQIYTGIYRKYGYITIKITPKDIISFEHLDWE